MIAARVRFSPTLYPSTVVENHGGLIEEPFFRSEVMDKPVASHEVPYFESKKLDMSPSIRGENQ